jgi:ribonuclease Z
MRPSLHPRLVNGPFDDPGLYISFIFENDSILFDLGDIHPLSSRDVFKIGHIFVSHTHMDHFSGFDRLLRLFLGRNKTINLYGPEGFIQNVQGKLAGYSWNLLSRYEHELGLKITEIHPDRQLCSKFSSSNQFLAEIPFSEKPFSFVISETPGWIVTTAILDHGIPSLAFSIKEKFHVNIIKDKLGGLGLEVGSWISAFKQSLYVGINPSTIFRIIDSKGSDVIFEMELGKLRDEIAIITRGQKVTYITDAVYSRENIDKMVHLAENADHLFIEAAFSTTHQQLAADKYHLTAHQAGTIAAMAGVKQFTVFHHSPRYNGCQNYLIHEANDGFAGIGHLT